MMTAGLVACWLMLCVAAFVFGVWAGKDLK